MLPTVAGWRVTGAPRRIGLTALVGALTVLAAACGGGGTDYREAAEKLIKGNLAAQAGLGEVTSACEEPPDEPKAGDSFACTATSAAGEVVRFTATVEEGSKVNVESINLITADGLDKIEQVAVESLEREVGQPLGRENFDCGDDYVVLDPSEELLVCTLTDPDSGNQYEATVDVPDLQDVSTLTVEVSDTPKS
jgi:hypothetical protein